MNSTSFPIEMKARLWRVLKACAIIGFIGLVIFLLSRFGAGIPCPFHLVTGLDCPGCGATRMLNSIFSLRFDEAWRYNPALTVLFPVLCVFFLCHAVRYVKTGRRGVSRWENRLAIAAVILLVLFGVCRNLPGYPY